MYNLLILKILLPFLFLSLIGHFLAVVCSDNNIRVLSAYNGKIVHKISCGQSLSQDWISHSPLSSRTVVAAAAAADLPTPVSCLGWGVSFTDSKSILQNLQDTGGKVTMDDILSSEIHLSKLTQLKADLPRELALLDIERSLPKLSTLPSTGNELVVP